jgi:hypothetical protein
MVCLERDVAPAFRQQVRRNGTHIGACEPLSCFLSTTARRAIMPGLFPKLIDNFVYTCKGLSALLVAIVRSGWIEPLFIQRLLLHRAELGSVSLVHGGTRFCSAESDGIRIRRDERAAQLLCVLGHWAQQNIASGMQQPNSNRALRNRDIVVHRSRCQVL